MQCKGEPPDANVPLGSGLQLVRECVERRRAYGSYSAVMAPIARAHLGAELGRRAARAARGDEISHARTVSALARARGGEL